LRSGPWHEWRGGRSKHFVMKDKPGSATLATPLAQRPSCKHPDVCFGKAEQKIPMSPSFVRSSPSAPPGSRPPSVWGCRKVYQITIAGRNRHPTVSGPADPGRRNRWLMRDTRQCVGFPAKTRHSSAPHRGAPLGQSRELVSFRRNVRYGGPPRHSLRLLRAPVRTPRTDEANVRQLLITAPALPASPPRGSVSGPTFETM
jgi:hypothetical protein